MILCGIPYLRSLLTDGSHHIFSPSDKWQPRSCLVLSPGRFWFVTVVSFLIWYIVYILYLEAFAMLGVLAWQVNYSNKKDIFVWGRSHGDGCFYPQVLPLVVCLCACVSLSFSLHPFKFSLQSTWLQHNLLCNLRWWWKPCNWSLVNY